MVEDLNFPGGFLGRNRGESKVREICADILGRIDFTAPYRTRERATHKFPVPYTIQQPVCSNTGSVRATKDVRAWTRHQHFLLVRKCFINIHLGV